MKYCSKDYLVLVGGTVFVLSGIFIILMNVCVSINLRAFHLEAAPGFTLKNRIYSKPITSEQAHALIQCKIGALNDTGG